MVPYKKDPKVYLSQPPLPFVPNDDMVLRTEQQTRFGAEMPICVEVTYHEIVKEQQWKKKL